MIGKNQKLVYNTALFEIVVAQKQPKCFPGEGWCLKHWFIQGPW
ncbi:hypothetical protein VULLAG_LOCUS6958 [Vulpes lagopus]